MTETTNPLPDDPAGATAMPEQSSLVDGSDMLVDGGAAGTDEGPGGVPTALSGVDKRGDEMPTVRGDERDEQSGVACEADVLSPTDASAPQNRSASAGESAAGDSMPAERGGR